jgi:hypothetical protein
MAVSDAGLLAIDLKYTAIGRMDEFGNELRYRAKTHIRWSALPRVVNAYDVFFVGGR